MAITWRNVNGSSGAAAAAANLMDSAGQSVNNAFSGFQGLIDTQRDIIDDNTNQLKVNNTRAFMDQLAQYRTAEAYQEALASGEIARKRQQYGAMIDQEATSADALRNRLATLRERETADYNHRQTTTQRDQAPIIRQIQTAIASNDDATYRRLMAENPGLHNAPELVQGYTSAERARLTQGREDRKYNQVQLMNNLIRQFDTASAERGDTLTVQAFEQAAIDQGLDPEYIQQGVGMLSGSFERDGQLYGDDKRAFEKAVGGLESKYGIGRSAFKGWENVDPVAASERVVNDFVQTDEDGNKFLFGMGDDDDRAAIVSEVMNYMRNGVPVRLGNGQEVTVPITEAVAKQAMQGIRGGSWEFDSTFKKRVTELVRDGSLQEDFNNYQAYRNELTDMQANRLRFAAGNRQGGQTMTTPAPQSPAAAAQQTPPASIARTPSVPVDTSVDGAAAYLRQRSQEATTPAQPAPQPQAVTQSSLMQTPIRELPGRVGNWFTETLDQNRQESTQRGAAQLRNVLDQRTPMPREQFREMLARNPFGLQQLSPEEINRLRDTYGEALINTYLE